MSRTKDRLVTLLLVTAALVVALTAVHRRTEASAEQASVAAITSTTRPAPTTTRAAAAPKALRAPAPAPTLAAPTTTAPPTTTRPPTTTTTTAPPTTTTAVLPAIRRLDRFVLTPDGTDRFDLEAGLDSIHWTAPASNHDANLREIAWDPTTPAVSDELACATWTGHTDHTAQQGIALRVRQDGDRWRAITVTKNVLMAAYSNFNVHTWDTARTGTHPDGRPALIEMEGTVHVEGVVEEWMVVKPLPWRICARAVGDHVDLKVWPLTDPEPAWGDPTYGGTVGLPPGWDYEGRAGWFAGHIPAGGFADAADLLAVPLAAVG